MYNYQDRMLCICFHSIIKVENSNGLVVFLISFWQRRHCPIQPKNAPLIPQSMGQLAHNTPDPRQSLYIWSNRIESFQSVWKKLPRFYTISGHISRSNWLQLQKSYQLLSKVTNSVNTNYVSNSVYIYIYIYFRIKALWNSR